MRSAGEPGCLLVCYGPLAKCPVFCSTVCVRRARALSGLLSSPDAPRNAHTQGMGKKSRRNRPNAGVRDMGTLTQEQVDRLRMPGIPSITPEKSEDFIKILERHPEHKTGDMSAVPSIMYENWAGVDIMSHLDGRWRRQSLVYFGDS